MPSVLIGGQSQYQLLTTALAMRMIDRGYVFIPYDTLLYSLPYQDANYYLLGNDTKLRKAYDGVVTITMDSGERNFFEAFRDAQDSYEIRSRTPPEQVRLYIENCGKQVIIDEEDIWKRRKVEKGTKTFLFSENLCITVSPVRYRHSSAPSTI